MLKLAIAAHKGGVGKTTVALNLALALARRGWRVLLADSDPQGGIGRSLQADLVDRAGLVDCLLDVERFDTAVVPTRLPELHLLPVGRTAIGSAAEWEPTLRDARRLDELWRHVADSYDLAIVDTPAGMYGITYEVLSTVDRLLVPMQAEPLALRTLAEVLDAVVQLRREGAALELAAVLMTMVQARNAVSLDVAREVWSSLPQALVLEAVVPRDDALPEATALGVPVALRSRRPPAVAAVFDQIAAELEPRLGVDQQEEAHEPISLLD